MTERHHAPKAEERLSEEAAKIERAVSADARKAEAAVEHDVEEAGAELKEGLAEGASSTHHELEMDRADAERYARRKEASLHKAAEALAHPNELREDVAAPVAREASKVERIADDLTHPSRELEAAKRAVEQRREAIEEAYKQGLVERRYIPVSRENLFDKLAAYQPLDSAEYAELERLVVSDFSASLGDLNDLVG